METETAETTEIATAQTDSSQAAAEQSATSAEPDGASEATEQPTESATELATATPAEFKANTKFKVMEKEHEIPANFAALMKDAASEKEVREIFEKAEGLPIVKERLEATRKERDTFSTELTGMKQSIEGLRGIYQDAVKTGNYLKLDNFLSALQIPEQHFMQWAIAKAKLQEMPEDQRNALMAQMDADRKADSLKQEKSTLQTQYQEQARQIKSIQLDSALVRADVKPLADSYDAKTGKPGSFREEVIRTGRLAYYTEGGIDLPVEQAIQRVAQNFGLTPAQAAAAVMPNAQAPTKQKTATIPNIQGRGSSPLKSKPKSIEDLKNLHKAMVQSEA